MQIMRCKNLTPIWLECVLSAQIQGGPTLTPNPKKTAALLVPLPSFSIKRKIINSSCSSSWHSWHHGEIVPLSASSQWKVNTHRTGHTALQSLYLLTKRTCRQYSIRESELGRVDSDRFYNYRINSILRDFFEDVAGTGDWTHS